MVNSPEWFPRELRGGAVYPRYIEAPEGVRVTRIQDEFLVEGLALDRIETWHKELECLINDIIAKNTSPNVQPFRDVKRLED